MQCLSETTYDRNALKLTKLKSKHHEQISQTPPALFTLMIQTNLTFSHAADMAQFSIILAI